MEFVNLTVEKRKEFGKGAMRKLREKNILPGVLYGKGKEALPIQMSRFEFEKLYSTTSQHAIYTLSFKDDPSEKPRKALVQQAQFDKVVSSRALHVDFYEFDEHKKVRVQVEVVPVGEPKGVKEGGILTLVHRMLEVECLPTEIPEEIKIEVSNLGIGDMIRVEDLKEQAGYHILAHPHDVVITIAAPKKEEAAAKPAAAEGEAPAEGAAAGATAGTAAAGAQAGAPAPGKETPKEAKK